LPCKSPRWPVTGRGRVGVFWTNVADPALCSAAQHPTDDRRAQRRFRPFDEPGDQEELPSQHAVAPGRPGQPVQVAVHQAAGGGAPTDDTVEAQVAAPAGVYDDNASLCRVAADRVRIADLVATVEGDEELAATVLSGLHAFARD
jgi:hypothetical protein